MTFEELRQAGDDVPDQGQPARVPASPFHVFRENPAVNPLGTPSGKIHIHSYVIDSYGYEGRPGTTQPSEPTEWLWSPKAATHPLHLVTKTPAVVMSLSDDNVDTLREVSRINGYGQCDQLTRRMPRRAGSRRATSCACSTTAVRSSVPRFVTDLRADPSACGDRAGRSSWYRPTESGHAGKPRLWRLRQCVDAPGGHLQARPGARWPRAPGERREVRGRGDAER